MIAFLKRVFASAIEKKQLRKNDSEQVARCFLSLIYGFLQNRILFRIPDVVRHPVEETIEEYVDIFLEGAIR